MAELENIFCYEDCEHLSLGEAQQNAQKDGKRIPHICNLYNKRVRHNGHAIHLTKLEGCDYIQK